MTAIELERLLAVAGLRPLHFAGKRLDGSSGQDTGQFGDVGTAQGAMQTLPDSSREAMQQIQADEAAVSVAVVFAVARIGRSQRVRLDVDDVKRDVDGQGQPHVVNGLPGAAQAGGKLEIACFGVDQLGLDIPQTIVTRINLQMDGTLVHQAAGGRASDKRKSLSGR